MIKFYEKDYARIKVQNSYSQKVVNDWVTVAIDKENPAITNGNYNNLKQNDLEIIFNFIKTNYKQLIDLWNDKIDPYDCIANF